MAKKNYYKILGVSRTASPEEISAAKNRLAKKYHPDANMKDWISIQLRKCSVFWKLTAYFPTQRSVLPMTAKYSESPSSDSDRNFDLFNLHNNIEETDPVIGTPFVNYWRAADSLYDITLESEQLFKDKNKENTRSARLSDLGSPGT